MRKSLMLLAILTLIAPGLFLGCEGDDGAAGTQGIQGTQGTQGPQGPAGSGPQVAEGCVVCHGAGKIVDVAEAHDPPTGTATANITSASFNPADNTASVTFTFAATDSGGNPLPDNVLLTPSGSNLAYARFTIARLIPGQLYPTQGTRDPDTWFYYGVRSHRSPSQLAFDTVTGEYTFTFVDNVVLDPLEAGYTHRVGIEIYGFSAGVRSVNPTFTFVPNQGILPEQDYVLAQTRDIVTTAACNECHNPLGYTPSPAFHSSRRVETRHCVLCHNSNNPLAPQSAGGSEVPIPFVKLVHGIHTAQNLNIFELENGVWENVGDFTEVTFPQDIRNCNKCHKGPDGQNWNTRPSREACGSCHEVAGVVEHPVNFDTGENHVGGPQPDNRLCALCHVPEGTSLAIKDVHRTENATPNNPDVPTPLANFAYFIDNVAVDNTGVASVTFRITKNGAPLDLSTYPPTGFTGGPSFLLAWALPQDGINAPADYTNTSSPATPDTNNGNGGGEAPSVSLASVASSLTVVDNTNKVYRARLTTRPFPTGAKMRAVALQSYFSQDVNNTPTVTADDIGRHTLSVVMPVPGDAVRRQVVDWQNGCLACHEILELHGGSRVNNTQVCVMCHNPNKSSSGRTVDPSQPSSALDELGGSPLDFPEAALNLKELVHGIHRSSDRPYEFVRNRLNGIYYNWDEVTFPGNLMDCRKCHIGNSYVPSSIPAGVLKSTERTTTGNTAETRAAIIAVRGTVPNDTDLVNSPIASACYYCHDNSAAASHMVLNGGRIRSTRTDVLLVFP